MAPPTTLDRSVHSDQMGSSEETGKRRGMKALLFSSAMKVMKKSYKVSDLQSSANIIDLAYLEASESSNSYSCSRIDDDYAEEQDETQDVTEKSSTSGTILETCPSRCTKTRITRKTDGKSKGRMGNIRRSGKERRRGNGSKELDTNSRHSQTSISGSSHHHHKFEILCEYNSQEEASSDEEGLLKDSGSCAGSRSQHSQMDDHSQQSGGCSFHGDGNSSYLELDLESMETSLHSSSQPKKPPARSPSRRRQPTVRSESLDDILISSAQHKIDSGRRRRIGPRQKPRPGPSRSKSLDLGTLQVVENELLESVSSYRIESLDRKDESQPIRPVEGNHTISRHRVSRTKSHRHDHAAVSPPQTAPIGHDVSTELLSLNHRPPVSRQPYSLSTRPRRYDRSSREINV